MKLSSIFLTPGRLLVKPIEAKRDDVFDVSEYAREISAAEVVKVGVLGEQFEGLVAGSVIVYERLNSEPLVLQDEEGKDALYRFVLVRDVAGWVSPEESEKSDLEAIEKHPVVLEAKRMVIENEKLADDRDRMFFYLYLESLMENGVVDCSKIDAEKFFEHAPVWCEFFAVNPDGRGYFFEKEPEFHEEVQFWDAAEGGSRKVGAKYSGDADIAFGGFEVSFLLPRTGVRKIKFEKLRAEELFKGIPDGHDFFAVDEDGDGFFYDYPPFVYKNDGFFAKQGKVYEYPEKVVVKNWKKSIIKRAK